MKVYIVADNADFNDDIQEKFLGVYTSKDKAKNFIEKYMDGSFSITKGDFGLVETEITEDITKCTYLCDGSGNVFIIEKEVE